MNIFKKSVLAVSVLALSAGMFTGCSNDGKEKNSSSNSVIYYSDTNGGNAQNNIVIGDADNNSDSNSKAENTMPAPPNDITSGNLGDTLDKNGVSISFEQIFITSEKTSDDTMLLCAFFDIKNETSEDLPVNFISNFTINIDGAEPKMTTLTSITAISMAKYKFSDSHSFDTTIASGDSQKGYISFEVPVSAQKVSLNYYPYNYEDNNVFGFSFNSDINGIPTI